MFIPFETTRRFDRNIFNGSGKEVTIKVKKEIDLLYFYMTDVVVGTISGKLKALVYEEYTRDKYLPVQIFLDGKDYCGWVNRELLTLSP